MPEKLEHLLSLNGREIKVDGFLLDELVQILDMRIAQRRTVGPDPHEKQIGGAPPNCEILEGLQSLRIFFTLKVALNGAQKRLPGITDSDVAVEILRGSRLSPAICKQLVDDHQISPLLAQNVVNTYQRNYEQGNLRGPGAIVSFFNRGRWPHDDVDMSYEELEFNRAQGESLKISQVGNPVGQEAETDDWSDADDSSFGCVCFLVMSLFAFLVFIGLIVILCGGLGQ